MAKPLLELWMEPGQSCNQGQMRLRRSRAQEQCITTRKQGLLRLRVAAVGLSPKRLGAVRHMMDTAAAENEKDSKTHEMTMADTQGLAADKVAAILR